MIRSKIKKIIMAYILALAPMNYVTTALATSSDLLKPKEVWATLQNIDAFDSVGGIINTATGGLFKPITAGISNGLGHATDGVANMFNSDMLKNAADSMINYSKDYFNAGKIKDVATNNNVAHIPEGFYKVIGTSQFTAEDNKVESGIAKYSELDKLGRTGIAIANINYKMIEKSAGHRDEFEELSDPSGWYQSDVVKVRGMKTTITKDIKKTANNKKVSIKLSNGKIYNGFAYNRSHLIADSLGGRAYRGNLITGTRMQNVGNNDLQGGMQYIERKVLDHIKAHKDVTARYKVTPIYVDNELVPRFVDVDVLTSDGKIDEHVRTFNVLPGFNINYLTGEISDVK